MTSPSPYQDPATARLFAYIARDARTAVILRRGPGTKTLMVQWDLATDTFTEGQWLHTRVYTARCDISPCGRYFAYFTGRFSGHYYAFTAISPVPYFTAHILWPQDHTWGGGALFDGPRKAIRLNRRAQAVPPPPETDARGRKLPAYMRKPAALAPLMHPDFGALPPPYETACPLWEHAGGGEDDPIEYFRMTRDGWVQEQKIETATIPRKHVPAPDDPNVSFTWKTEGAMIWAKTIGEDARARTLRLIRDQHGEVNGRSVVMTATLTDASGKVRDFQRVDWADFGPNGDLLYARNGALYRLPAGSKDAPRKLIDLNDREVRSVLPPDGMPKRRATGRGAGGDEGEAESGAEGEEWHPLDGE